MTDQLFTGSYSSDALTEAKQLRAENERLRAALREIAGLQIICASDMARAALQKQEGGE